jgi:chitin disaccharide deacetylase
VTELGRAFDRILVVNADDLGYDPAIDRGIFDACEKGIVRSATILVAMPFAATAMERAKSLGLGLGLHVNLVRGPSVAGARSWIGASGEMDEACLPGADPKEVALEIEAQIGRFWTLAGREPTHLDFHRHSHRFAPVMQGLLALAARAARRPLPVRALDESMRRSLRSASIPCTDHFLGDAVDKPYWTLKRLSDAVSSIEPGITELMCHPGYRPTHVKTRYGPQREVELASLCDPGVREKLTASGLKLCHFGEAFPVAT